MDREYTSKLLARVRPESPDVAPLQSDEPLSPGTILHAVYAALIKGDYETYRASLAEDVKFSICGFGPMDGTWHGRDQVVAATRNNFALVDAQQPEIEGIIAQGNSVAVLLRERGSVKATGQKYDIRCVQWFTFADAKITRIDEIVAGL